MEWLLAPIDPTRTHEIGFAVSWHGRTMVLAWGILAPLSVIMARYFKIMPGQDWPRELDNQLWWRGHWMGQALVVLLTLFGLGLILGAPRDATLHGLLGYTLLCLMGLQILLGVFRGSKGGPTDPAPDGSPRGDHYDMTAWRVMFEWAHKLFGYAALVLSAIVISAGLWEANAPRWMWLSILAWWVFLMVLSIILQRQRWAVDTYQAIWGPDPKHPGNRRKPIGWGIYRRTEGEGHVRRN